MPMSPYIFHPLDRSIFIPYNNFVITDMVCLLYIPLVSYSSLWPPRRALRAAASLTMVQRGIPKLKLYIKLLMVVFLRQWSFFRVVS